MPDPVGLVRTRRNRRMDEHRSQAGRLRMGFVGIGIVLSLAIALLLLAAGLAYADLTRDLPNVDYLRILLSPPDGLLLQPTRVYDRTGQHLLLTMAPRDAPRRYLPLNAQAPQHLPLALAKAVVAAADPGFWSHGGFKVTGWNVPGEHPTVAQRLVSDLLLYGERPSIRRALRERLLAAQITQDYGRDQILEWTLNSADFGNQAFGAEAAAQLYFGKSATKLTLGESAMLAAAMQTPNVNPLDAPTVALERRNQVLRLMFSLGMISADDEAKAQAEPPPLPPTSPEAATAMAPAFLHLVRSQIDQRALSERIERGGVIVTTTLDYDLQQAAACTIATYVRRLQALPDVPEPCAAADRLPALPPGTIVPEAEASALILDPQTGQVLAAVGETLKGVETTALSAHDPGTLINPFIYLTAFTRGLSPASLTWDIPAADEQPLPGATYQGPVRMRIALVNDYKGPAKTVAAQMGTEAIGQTESSFGLRGDSATLMDVAAAYGILAAQGVRYGQPGPSTLLRVEGLDHAVWLDLSEPQGQPVLSAPLAYLMNNVLSDDGARAPSLGHPNPLELDRPAGAKIGQADSGQEAWAVGYTPQRVTAVWVGTQTSDTTLGRSPRAVASLWNGLMQAATASQSPDGWLVPAGVTAMDVCDPSGMLPTKDCPSVVSEVFLTGNEPVQGDTLYKTFAVNRETGLLATVFTPSQLVEDRVYMVVPAEAQAWAKWANVPAAPAAYDAIQSAPINPEVRITAPLMFADVDGQVQIRGTAGGDGFSRYRILVGQGINPQFWIAVGSDSTTPVGDGLLATWDTTGLSGLYAVQLQVIRSDQRVDTSIVQVTVKGN